MSFLNVGRLEGSIIQPAEQRETQCSPVHGFRNSDQGLDFPLCNVTHSVIDQWGGQHIAEREDKCLPLFLSVETNRGYFYEFTAPEVEAKLLNIHPINKSQKYLI